MLIHVAPIGHQCQYVVVYSTRGYSLALFYVFISVYQNGIIPHIFLNCSFFVIVCLSSSLTCLCNESVSQVRFAPELLEDQDPIGVDTPTRWKWQVPEAVPLGAPDWLVVPTE